MGCPMVPGCHSEGPYIAGRTVPRGAHRREYVRPPDWKEFEKLQQMSGGRIRLVTLAPELPGAVEFIRRAVAERVVISHRPYRRRPGTDCRGRRGRASAEHASRETVRHGTIRRHPNYIWEQLGDPRLSTSVIADGHHLPASVLQFDHAHQSDSKRDFDLRCGRSRRLCPRRFIPRGRCRWRCSTMAGSWSPGSGNCLPARGPTPGNASVEAMQQAGVSLAAGHRYGGRNPSRLLGFEEIRLRPRVARRSDAYSG